jgi:hypothetical protein
MYSLMFRALTCFWCVIFAFFYMIFVIPNNNSWWNLMSVLAIVIMLGTILSLSGALE